MSIVLFDMDGTLTPARQEINDEMIKKLETLTDHARVGIVSGSGFEYIWEQVGKHIVGFPELASVIDILACNGTKFYRYDWNPCKYTLVEEHDAKDEWGETTHEFIMRTCIKQLDRIHEQYHIPLTGHFISDRGSLINFCPIGRNASQHEREQFANLDRQFGIRNKLYRKLRKKFGYIDCIEIALGGSTSIDIYPAGWDKTFALRYYPDAKAGNVYFVGDRCQSGGNDQALYETLEPGLTSWETTGPKRTIQIIDVIISSIKCKK